MRWLATLLVLACAPAMAQGLLRNGGFERGTFAGWTLSGNAAYSQVFDQEYDGLSAKGGNDYALLGPRGAPGVLSQIFRDDPGSVLAISFWLASDGSGPTDFFSARLDDATLAVVAGGGAAGWTHYVASAIATGDDTLAFTFRDDNAYFALDRVSVRQRAEAPIPEVGTLPLLLCGLVILGVRRARSLLGRPTSFVGKSG